MIRTDPRLIDGAEAVNTHDNVHCTPLKDQQKAVKWVRDNDLIPLIGQDFHDAENILGAKTALYGEVKDSETLVKKLLSKEFDIILPNN